MERLRHLRPGWNEASPIPNETAFGLTGLVLDVLDDARLTPSRVVPDAEGGLSIYFLGKSGTPGRYASLSCSNEGEIVALTHDRAGEPHAWSIGTDRAATQAAVDRIRTFLPA